MDRREFQDRREPQEDQGLKGKLEQQAKQAPQDHRVKLVSRGPEEELVQWASQVSTE